MRADFPFSSKPRAGGSQETAPPLNTTGEASTSLSTSGAFNGTGIALLDQGSDSVNLFVYYQNHAGQVRSSALVNNKWTSRGDADIGVAPNVKNGTPLATVSYTLDGAMTV